ncbi:YihY/virulence factor BrkB family protein [Bradyrhizobium sp. CCGB12]|uniref:YihY/virulence factor BrkB family protein n=1 Tax=Bradyrhizobium sp. CCGB12 TaxID=2949632 RepID=UPI00281146EB|nr:YihY/virulence factor BrkB family protein [Bradyrhizobium sp. CCGB12]
MLNFIGLSNFADLMLRIARWPAMFVAVALALIYRYEAIRGAPRWRWITWGSAAAAVLWLGASAMFSWYGGSFGKFNETYGSLGAVIGFMTWLWISGIRPPAIPWRARRSRGGRGTPEWPTRLDQHAATDGFRLLQRIGGPDSSGGRCASRRLVCSAACRRRTRRALSIVTCNIGIDPGGHALFLRQRGFERRAGLVHPDHWTERQQRLIGRDLEVVERVFRKYSSKSRRPP